MFNRAGSITTNGGRAPHDLHPLALLWSNPAGLVRHGTWEWAHLNESARANADQERFKGAAMLATLNSKQIVDEIVKDTIKDNDPHDAVQISPDIQISPDMVQASRPISVSPTLAPDIALRPEPKFAPEQNISIVYGAQAAAPSVDSAVRVEASDGRGRRKRSAVSTWLRGASVAFLFAGGSAAAAIAWEQHGDTARQMLAQWTPALASLTSQLLPATPQTAPVAAAQAAPPAAAEAPPAATDQIADQPASPPQPATATAAAPPDATQSMESMTRDMAAMAQQIEQLKTTIAELKAGQEQLAREMTKPPVPKPVAEAKPVDPRARVSAIQPRPAPPPVRKPKPAVSHTYMPAYSPAPLAPPPPPSQAAAAPPPVAPVTTTQAVADDDGPVVRPPMPVH
ncbi:hypothetical protein WN72_23330 [Bradyrhizobium arachidis]|uniref:Uncharacterized protein n=2 Tax=Bradyrhizobium arachidis TaxID=858423 RepID=A0AAE7NXA8_9BRAD|nr:hypothetical protein WN72_23330 [Bradyrhizobium arachidis]